LSALEENVESLGPELLETPHLVGEELKRNNTHRRVLDLQTAVDEEAGRLLALEYEVAEFGVHYSYLLGIIQSASKYR
jgi:hypothetical protein